MINVSLSASSVVAWPVFALIVHALIPNFTRTGRKICQGIFILIWLLLTLMLLITNTKPYVIMMGNWAAPFGITLVFDRLSCVILLVFAIVATCINWYSYQDQDISDKQQAFYIGFWLLLLGVTGSILTADIFNLYVWFEVVLVSAFILLASTTKLKPYMIIHYAVINITGTLLMLLAVALLYGVFGSLSYASIANALLHIHSALALPILSLLLFAIGIKGAVFPLYFWLPKAYPKPSYSSTMLLSSLITKTVMIVLLRLVWLWQPLHGIFITTALLISALGTMFFGVMGAANQFRFKDILAFHIISQLGYILLAIILPVPLAIIAAVYFLIHNIFVKTNLFMIAGIIEKYIGTDDFKKLGQLLKHHKLLAAAFFVSSMSLAGIPPLSGFWGKFLVIKAALTAHYYFSAVIAIVVSLFTLYSMIKIWRYVFCEKAAVPQYFTRRPFSFSINIIIAMLPLLFIPIVMGILPDILLTWLKVISQQLQSSQSYIHLILGVN